MQIDNTNRMETFFSISVWKSTIVKQKMETFISLFLFYCFLCCIFHVRHIRLHLHLHRCPVVQFYASLGFLNTCWTLMIVTVLFTFASFFTVHAQNTVILCILDMCFFMLEEARLANINFKAISFMTHTYGMDAPHLHVPKVFLYHCIPLYKLDTVFVLATTLDSLQVSDLHGKQTMLDHQVFQNAPFV